MKRSVQKEKIWFLPRPSCGEATGRLLEVAKVAPPLSDAWRWIWVYSAAQPGGVLTYTGHPVAILPSALLWTLDCHDVTIN